MADLSALYRDDATLEETVAAYQDLINTGSAWTMEGHTGRTAMRLIEDGYCILGEAGLRDYWGNYVPSRTEVKAGTKGSVEYARERRPEFWPEDDDATIVPKDFPVQPLQDDATATARVTCGTCGLSWDDAQSTEYTPAPSGRCPFEAFHPTPRYTVTGDETCVKPGCNNLTLGEDYRSDRYCDDHALIETPDGGRKARSFDADGIIYETDVNEYGRASKYTRNDFLALAGHNEAAARDLFNRVTWQHPETLLAEDDEDAADEEAIDEANAEAERMIAAGEIATPESLFEQANLKLAADPLTAPNDSDVFIGYAVGYGITIESKGGSFHNKLIGYREVPEIKD